MGWARCVEWTVVLPTLGLLAFGLFFIWSATLESASDLLSRQLLFVATGVVGMVLIARLGVGWLIDRAMLFYVALTAVLVLLPILAEPSTLGSDRWIRLPFGFKLQPSEFMKLGLVLALAHHLRHAGVTNTWRSYIKPFLLTAVPWFFVMRQPDLGSSLVMLPVFLAMVWVSGARPRHLLLVTAAVGVLLPLAYLTPGVLEPYQKDRLDAFLVPIPSRVEEARGLRDRREHTAARRLEKEISELKRGTGYQQFYSVVAVGSGGLTGAGLGRGIQNRGNRLPVRHADFIFAVIGEEAGLLGTGLVLLLYASLLTAILGVALRTREPFGRLVCVGVAALIGGQALLNLGIATGLLPVTGLPLPLVSYGGSSILATLLAIGCVLDVARTRIDVFFEQ
jgi:rod shape determining protein RodA